MVNTEVYGWGLELICCVLLELLAAHFSGSTSDKKDYASLYVNMKR